ncbi:MAG: sulfatase-like hydrolase/transferase [Pirellulaceae bacterium]
MRFEHAHVSIAVCQPCRAVWMTGQYPHHNGALGFNTIDEGVRTLPEHLRDHGYFVGLFGKNTHVVPSRAAVWHVNVPTAELGQGRRGDLYHTHVAAAISAADDAELPFFLMVNIHDPHRPFAITDANRAANQRARGKATAPRINLCHAE